MTKHIKSILLAFASLIPASQTVMGQNHEIYSDDISSLKVVADDRWLSLPIIDMNAGETVNISFDQLSHEYHRYTYKIEHCEADWSTTTSLFESDFIDGFYNGLVIDNVELSLNTAQLYTHYSLTIPNKDCRLKLSGNYRLTVMDDNDDSRPVLSVCFMLSERKMGSSLIVSSNTDIDTYRSHQQLSATISYNGTTVNDPQRQLKAYILQNNRWATLRKLPRPTSQRYDGVAWEHCRDMIYPATNEYRKFEVLDIHRSSLGIDHISFDDPEYHAWLYTDIPRPNYVYDEDANGAFYIRNTDNIANDTESEYVICHFAYKADEPFPGDMFLDGQWTYGRLAPEYAMTYDPLAREYHGAVKLKMGYYSYQYLLRRPDGSVVTLPADGNYHETENSYLLLVYFRPVGGRTDLLYSTAVIGE